MTNDLSIRIRAFARRYGPMLLHRCVPALAALALLVVSMGGRWRLASASPKSSSLLSDAPVTSSSSVLSNPPEARSSSAPSDVAAPGGSAVPSNAASATGAASARVATAADVRDPDVLASDLAPRSPVKKSSKDLSGKLNLNTASEQQLLLLPTVGPAKAERIVTWRKKNGGFRRTADLRRVKGFGYKTFKRLEPFLDVKGASTLR